MTGPGDAAGIPADGFQPIPFIDLARQHAGLADLLRSVAGRVLDSGQFVLGDEVAAFEDELAAWCDAELAIGCGSGTDALVLSLMALGIGPGHEGITTPFTFFATAGAIHRVGAKPVFVDIDPASFNIDPEAVAAAVTDRTRAIMPVHLFGQCADMEPLWRLAAGADLAIVEDACQAIGAEYRGRRAGVLGTLAAFSFFPTKNLGGAGDGGLVTTDNHELAERVRRLRVHGDLGGYRHVEVGLNSRLDALQAALLRVKLTKLGDWTESRRENARRYDELFEASRIGDSVRLPADRIEGRHVYNQYTIRVTDGRRDEVAAALREQGIGCAVYYPSPLHLQPCFASLGGRPGQLPIAEAAAAEVLSLPVFPGITPAEQRSVVGGIAIALADDAGTALRQAA